MKQKSLFLGLILLTFAGYSQTGWYTQNSNTNSYLFDVHFANQSEGWASGLSGLILHTNDGGSTWNPQNPPPNNYYLSIFFTDNQNGWATGYGGKIIQTSDGGNTWNQQTSNSTTELYKTFFINSSTGWVVGGDNGVFPSFIKHRAILFTNNGGNTWTSLVNTTGKSLLRDVHFVDQNIGFAVGESGTILFTPNGGVNWIEQMSDQFYHFYGVHFTDANNGYVVGEYLGLPHVSVIFNTTDGGLSWNSQTFGTDEGLSDVFFTDFNNGWAVGGSATEATILRTTDGGFSWFAEDPGTDKPLSAIHMIDANNGWAVGHLGTIINTSRLTGIGHEENKLPVEIYPNPATDVFNINMTSEDFGYGNVTILNMAGQVVYRSNVTSSQNTNQRIDTRNFSEGIYTVVVENAADRMVKKVIIRK